ncbi:MAG: flavodoxin [Bacteroidaceae bacterium]|nr:flavodoxin [Bacteroidaceae bacterium]
MRKLITKALCTIVAATGITASLSSCGGQKKAAQEAEQQEDSIVVLVAYFSATGTTRNVAERMEENIPCDLVEIRPAQPYTEADLDWRDKQSRSTLEMNDSTARPEMEPLDIDLSKYELIYLGYPIWWGVAPRIINTFLEKYDLKGKEIIPFCTSGGSPVEPSVEALRRQYPDYHFQEGLLLNNVGEDGLIAPEEPAE